MRCEFKVGVDLYLKVSNKALSAGIFRFLRYLQELFHKPEKVQAEHGITKLVIQDFEQYVITNMDKISEIDEEEAKKLITDFYYNRIPEFLTRLSKVPAVQDYCLSKYKKHLSTHQ